VVSIISIFIVSCASDILLNVVFADYKLEVIPREISLKVPSTKVDKIPTYSIQLISPEDLRNVSVMFSPLSSEETGKMWIPRGGITSVPSTFNLTHNKVTNLDILFKLPNETGSYRGTATFASPEKILSVVDTKVEIFQPTPVISIIAVALGVIVAFMIKYVRSRMTVRTSALEIIEKFRITSLRAEREGRNDENFKIGNEEARRALGYFRDGDFEYAKQTMETAVDSMASAKVPEGRIVQGAGIRLINDMIDEVRKRGLRDLFKQKNSIIFFLTSTAVFVVILKTWMQVYNQIQSSGESFLGIIVAFLLGYGTQSLLGEAFDSKPT